MSDFLCRVSLFVDCQVIWSLTRGALELIVILAKSSAIKKFHNLNMTLWYCFHSNGINFFILLTEFRATLFTSFWDTLWYSSSFFYLIGHFVLTIRTKEKQVINLYVHSRRVYSVYGYISKYIIVSRRPSCYSSSKIHHSNINDIFVVASLNY